VRHAEGASGFVPGRSAPELPFKSQPAAFYGDGFLHYSPSRFRFQERGQIYRVVVWRHGNGNGCKFCYKIHFPAISFSVFFNFTSFAKK
jgi:hypothetical protein